MLNPRVAEKEGCRYEVVESKVVESKFVEFMLHSRRGSSGVGAGVASRLLDDAEVVGLFFWSCWPVLVAWLWHVSREMLDWHVSREILEWHVSREMLEWHISREMLEWHISREMLEWHVSREMLEWHVSCRVP